MVRGARGTFSITIVNYLYKNKYSFGLLTESTFTAFSTFSTFFTFVQQIRVVPECKKDVENIFYIFLHKFHYLKRAPTPPRLTPWRGPSARVGEWEQPRAKDKESRSQSQSQSQRAARPKTPCPCKIFSTSALLQNLPYISAIYRVLKKC